MIYVAFLIEHVLLPLDTHQYTARYMTSINRYNIRKAVCLLAPRACYVALFQ